MAKARKKKADTSDIHADGSDDTTAVEPMGAESAEDESQGEAAATGYVRDFISGLRVRATPEEVQATQVFSRRLVEDFGYPVDRITTRPQFRVSRRPFTKNNDM